MSCSNWPTLFLVASLFLWQICRCDDGVYAWRKGASAVVMNEQLFIQGGISSKPKRLWSDGWAIENQTFAIPLGRSWVKSEIDMAQYANENAMYKNISADNPSMWTKDDKQIIFWGGAGSFGRPNLAATSPRPWAYTPSGSSGQYGSVAQAASQRPTDKTTQDPLYRTGGGSWTQCNGLGFYMGGFIGSATDSGFPHQLNGTGQRALTGLLIYDIAAGTWRNRTTLGSGFGAGRMEGTHVSGQAVCLPTLGKDNKGVVLFLTGYHGTWESRWTREFVRTDQITFYDIGSDAFYTQQTTGTPPKQREQPCAVAAKAKNSNTYEVVLFGGSGATPADTYILAVPGFVWFPVAPVAGGTNLADEGRRDHACVVVGKGGRQMLAVGGSEAKDNVNDVWKRRDPWGDNSMHVFDMTDLKWKPDYAYDAPDYQQPAMVRSWYKNSGLKNVTWGSKDTQALFAQVIENPLTGETPTPNAPTDSPPPIGPIVGGVIGGLAFFALVGCLVFYFVWYKPRRRARGAAANAQQQQDDSQQSYMGQTHYYTPGHHHQLDGDTAAKWSAVSSSPPHQLESTVYTELPASPGLPYEMQGSQAGSHPGSPKARFEQERTV